jgi:FlaA1/EpsC-like NDP-sugar epimerase
MKIISLAKLVLSKNSWFVGAFQAALILGSFIFAWFLTFDFTLPHRSLLFSAACLLIVIRMAAIVGFGLLHGWWRYTGLSDVVDVAKSVFFGSIVFVLSMQYALHAAGFPRVLYVLEPLLTGGILLGVRFLSRILAESVRQDLSASKRVLLVGAGAGAQTVVREIAHPGSEYAQVGYVDDDRSKLGLKIANIPVLGTVDELPKLVATYPIDEVLIAVPSASSRQMQRIVELCERTAVKFRTLPALRDVIARRISLSDFRDVNVEDLLGSNWIFPEPPARPGRIPSICAP